MSHTSVPVLLYRYDSSPYSRKVDHILALKGIPHGRVQVSNMLPRPEITDALGVKYRRIPILAIGNDVYCDTNIITTALERRFPASEGFGTIFPKTKHSDKSNSGIVKAFTRSFVEALFGPVVGLIPWTLFPEAFLKDRSALLGAPINPKVMVERRPKSESIVSTNMVFVEEQLRDGREWLFDTEQPNLADVSLHFILAWAKSMPENQALFDQTLNPNINAWIERLSKLLEDRVSKNSVTVVEGFEAAKKVISSGYEPYDVVGFDATEAARLAISVGDLVEVAPEDTGRNYPTTGKLVALSREEITLEVTGTEGLVRCHFPRLGFSIKSVQSSKL